MKFLILLAFAFNVHAEALRSEKIREVIGSAVSNADLWQWDTEAAEENLEGIWVTQYDKYPDSFEFNVVFSTDRNGDGAVDLMRVDVSVPCGTTLDESELSGSCKVTAKKTGLLWSAEVQSCICESGE